jgi:hypothetical protein
MEDKWRRPLKLLFLITMIGNQIKSFSLNFMIQQKMECQDSREMIPDAKLLSWMKISQDSFVSSSHKSLL